MGKDRWEPPATFKEAGGVQLGALGSREIDAAHITSTDPPSDAVTNFVEQGLGEIEAQGPLLRAGRRLGRLADSRVLGRGVSVRTITDADGLTATAPASKGRSVHTLSDAPAEVEGGRACDLAPEAVRTLLAGAGNGSRTCAGCGVRLIGQQRTACSARCRAVLRRHGQAAWIRDWEVRAYRALGIV